MPSLLGMLKLLIQYMDIVCDIVAILQEPACDLALRHWNQHDTLEVPFGNRSVIFTGMRFSSTPVAILASGDGYIPG